MDANEIYSLVGDTHGNPIFDKHNNVMTIRESDADLRYMEYELAVQMFPDLLQANEACASSHSLQLQVQPCTSEISDNSSLNSDGRSPWKTADIKELIRLYKAHLPQFRSSTLKNDKVWQMIADNLQSHTVDQIKNKFKYLKQKYTEKKDNMKSTSSGAATIKFAYYEEMDEIFGKDANICPVSTASSSRGSLNLNNCIDIEGSDNCSTADGDDSPPTEERKCTLSKKRKRSQLGMQLSTYEENVKVKEAAKQKRHDELMQRQDDALDILKNIAKTFSQIASTKN